MAALAFLVFDLDGTLSDPVVGIGRCINFALKHFGHPLISEDAASNFVGPPIDVTFASITGSKSQEHIAALVSKFRERYGTIGYSENVVYPGIPETLDALALAGIPMGLCTSKRVDFAERILDLFGLRQYFRFLSGGEVSVQKKQQLASLLSEKTISAHSVMIGDRATDVTAAQINGLKSAGVLWGHGSRQELTLAKPTFLFDTPSQLLELRRAV